MHPVYLLLGPEAGEKAGKIKEIRKELRDNLGYDPEIHRFYPFENEKDEILVALRNNSLFADHRLVLLSQAETLSAAQASSLIAYIQNPSPSATLIIVSAENRIDQKLQKAIPKEQTTMFWEMFEDKKQQWVQNYFAKQGFDIADEAVETLLDLVENNTQELKTAAQQILVCIPSGQDDAADYASIGLRPEITIQDIEKFIYHSRKENVFTLFEHIMLCDLPGSLEILKTLRLSGEAVPPALFGGLLWQFRRLHSLLQLLEEGFALTEAFSKVRVMGKASAIKGKKLQQLYAAALNHYTAKDIARIIIQIGNFDIVTREADARTQHLLLELFLYICIIKKGKGVEKPQFASFAPLPAVSIKKVFN